MIVEFNNIMSSNVYTWGRQIEIFYWDDRDLFSFLLLRVNWPCLAASPPLSCSLTISFKSTGGENKVENNMKKLKGWDKDKKIT